MAGTKDNVSPPAPTVDPIMRGVAEQYEMLGQGLTNDQILRDCDQLYHNQPQSPLCNAVRTVVKARAR